MTSVYRSVIVRIRKCEGAGSDFNTTGNCSDLKRVAVGLLQSLKHSSEKNSITSLYKNKKGGKWLKMRMKYDPNWNMAGRPYNRKASLIFSSSFPFKFYKHLRSFYTVNISVYSMCSKQTRTESGRQWHFRKTGHTSTMCVSQKSVCNWVPVVCVGEGECSEEGRKCEEASLCSCSTLIWSSALRISSSFKLWCTGTWNTHHTLIVTISGFSRLRHPNYSWVASTYWFNFLFLM